MYTVLPNCIHRADGFFIPVDPENRDYADYLDWLAEGNVPGVPPQPTHAELVEQAIDQIRVERQPILGVLDGLQATSLTKSDTTTAVVIETAKQALRDLTKIDLSACETLAEMKVAVLTRYALISAASPALKSAFTEAIR